MSFFLDLGVDIQKTAFKQGVEFKKLLALTSNTITQAKSKVSAKLKRRRNIDFDMSLNYLTHLNDLNFLKPITMCVKWKVFMFFKTCSYCYNWRKSVHFVTRLQCFSAFMSLLIEQNGTNRLSPVYVLAPIVSTRVLYFLFAYKVSLSRSVQLENNDCKRGNISVRKVMSAEKNRNKREIMLDRGSCTLSSTTRTTDLCEKF